MDDNIINNYASTIITIFQNVINTYENDLEVITQTQNELVDLEHEIEFSDPLDMYKGWLLYKKIRDARIRRRAAKERVELLNDMYNYLKSQNGENFANKIKNIQGNSVKLRAAQKARTYHPRQRNDLTITNRHSDANKPFEQMLTEFKKNKAYMKNGKLRK